MWKAGNLIAWFCTVFPSTFHYINPYLSILLSCSFFCFPFILLLSTSISLSFNSCSSNFNVTTRLNISSCEEAPLGQSSRDVTTAVLLIFFVLMDIFFNLAGPEKWERVHQAETCPRQFLWRRASHLYQLQQERLILPVGLRVCVGFRFDQCSLWRLTTKFVCFSFRQLTL